MRQRVKYVTADNRYELGQEINKALQDGAWRLAAITVLPGSGPMGRDEYTAWLETKVGG